jgi:hypothetical protein
MTEPPTSPSPTYLVGRLDAYSSALRKSVCRLANIHSALTANNGWHPSAASLLRPPAGGQIMVELDPAKLLARGLTPLDVVNTVSTQRLTLPSGTAKIGDKQYTVRTNATPATLDDL